MPIFVLHAEKLSTSFGVLEKSVSPTFFFLHGLASKGLSWEQVTSPELRLPRLCTQVHLASVLFSWDKYPRWRLCSCPGTWPPHQITTFDLNSEHPSVQAELFPICHQMKPFWGHERSTATILVPAHFSLSLWFCSLPSSFNHPHACMSYYTDLVSNHFNYRSQNLSHCALLSLQRSQSLTQEKYYHLPLTFLLSRDQHPWYVYETGPVDSNIVFLQTSLQLTIPFFTSKLFIPSEWKWKWLSCIPCTDMTPWTIQSMEFFRPEYWSGYPLQYCFSRESSQPRDQTQASCLASRFFISWATRKALPSENLL